jgi:hypothetical protein
MDITPFKSSLSNETNQKQFSQIDFRNSTPITAFKNGDTPSFMDIIDIINPLQHIPIVNTLYRQMTGDNEGFISDIVGGALYGGIIGLAYSMVDSVINGTTGKSIGANVATLILDSPTHDETAIASRQSELMISQIHKPTLLLPEEPQLGSSQFDVENRSNKQEDPIKTKNVDTKLLISDKQGWLVFSSDPEQNLTKEEAQLSSSKNFKSYTTSQYVAPSTQIQSKQPDTNQSVLDDNTPQTTADNSNHQVAKAFPIPSRNGISNPKLTLPPPTTGPAAIPGHGPSQAIVRPSIQNNQDDNDEKSQYSKSIVSQEWFIARMNSGLEKYQKAAQLNNNIISTETSLY